MIRRRKFQMKPVLSAKQAVADGPEQITAPLQSPPRASTENTEVFTALTQSPLGTPQTIENIEPFISTINSSPRVLSSPFASSPNGSTLSLSRPVESVLLTPHPINSTLTSPRSNSSTSTSPRPSSIRMSTTSLIQSEKSAKSEILGEELQSACKRPPSELMSPIQRVVIDEDEDLDVESVCQASTAPATPMSVEEVKAAKRRRISALRHEEVIDPKKFTLADLVDWRPRTENTLRKKWAERRQKALEKEAENMTRSQEAKLEQKPETKFAGPRVRINEHGQMVIDEESLVVTNETDPDTWEIVDDDLLPKKLNSMSFRKKFRSNTNWSIWETDLFYEVLCATGTDFGLMHEFIPTRTRAEIKRKFNREEKLDPERIDEVLHNPTILDETFRERVIRLKQKVDEKLAEKLAAKIKTPSGRPRGRPRKICRENDDDAVSVASCS